jgi:hypothetical protein
MPARILWRRVSKTRGSRGRSASATGRRRIRARLPPGRELGLLGGRQDVVDGVLQFEPFDVELDSTFVVAQGELPSGGRLERGRLEQGVARLTVGLVRLAKRFERRAGRLLEGTDLGSLLVGEGERTQGESVGVFRVKGRGGGSPLAAAPPSARLPLPLRTRRAGKKEEQREGECSKS